MIAGMLWAVSLIAADPTAEQLELLKTFRAEFVTITPGEGSFPRSFRMGSEQVGEDATPLRVVSFAKPFHFARYEVPQNLWEAVMGSNPSRWKGRRNSSEMFSWTESVEFCRRATELMRSAKLIGPDETLRLPTEAEWEYCAGRNDDRILFRRRCRGAQRLRLVYGQRGGQRSARRREEAERVGAVRHARLPVGMVLRHLARQLRGAPTDGSSWSADGDATKRVLRSGSWKDKAGELRSAYRRAAAVELKDDAVGLRCVLSR